MFKKIWIGIASVSGVVILILDSETVMIGAREGIDLCIRSVIPSLFPFLFLSGIITTTLSSAAGGKNHGSGKVLLMLTGYLSGYPAGAQSAVQAKHTKLIADWEVKRMLICCNNPGPAFIFGIAAGAFTEKKLIWVLWGIHIISSLVLYWIIPPDLNTSKSIHSIGGVQACSHLAKVILTISQICGCIILFRVLICVLEYRLLGHLPMVWKTVVCGMLELTNGCIALDGINCLGLRFCLCALFLSFGGCCTWIQTHSVTNGLYTWSYFLWKLVEGCFSFLLAYVFQICVIPAQDRFCSTVTILIVIIVMAGILFHKLVNRKNNGRNLVMIGV